MDKQNDDLDVVRTEPEDTVAAVETPAAEQAAETTEAAPEATPPAAPAEPEVSDAPAAPSAAASDTVARKWWDTRWIERGVAAAVIGVLAAVAGYFFMQNRDHTHELAYRAAAQDAACAYAPTLANYDAKDLDSYFRAVDAGATGDWRKQFDDTSKDLRDVLTQGQVVSKVSDVQCAWKSGNDTNADVIVVIGQSITSVGTKGKPEPGQLSMVLSLQQTNGKWLINKVNTPLNTQP